MDIDNFLNQHENKGLLRFLTSGSVDDGKSTLIGRLLYDSKMIYEDQLAKLKEESKKSGNKDVKQIDYSLLLDGLKAEREQGITIDVAYRYFSTPNRKFIIADTPGHEQYTRNMATGASTADLAIILIDARKGVITQTRRHAFIISLLGIKHVIVAVNKMDLVDYNEQNFLDIMQEFNQFTEQLDLQHKYFIPVSALKGDNVVDRSDQTGWYQGLTLLETLESVNVTNARNFRDFRFPVQWVNRPNLDFRGFSGTIVSGVVKQGDAMMALPSRRTSRVARIVTADGDLAEAFAPQAVTLVLEDEIDISSGEMLVHASNVPAVANSFEAYVVWMDEKELKPADTFLIRHAGRTTRARIDTLKYQVDVNTLQKGKTGALRLNEIGNVNISTTRPLFFDPYSKNRETGSFVLIDPVTNKTAAAGMIVEALFDDHATGFAESEERRLESQVEKREFLWDTGMVTPLDRARRNHHRGKTVLLTGAAGTRKREVAKKLEKRLFDSNLQAYYLGAGNVQSGLDYDIPQDFATRDEHVRRLGELARIITDSGQIFITIDDGVGDYDIEKLKRLCYPNELFVVTVGESFFKDFEADVHLQEQSLENAVEEIMQILSENSIIPEYCI
ncbi:MAG: sulfate adenylyltransferase subunit CysN [Kiritimatiellae bacterium]|nr:sulfate adenylyltransferase subunit CysN [Kiritimatiellia bacterium]